MEIVSYKNCADLDALGDTWDYLSEKELTFVPSFSELKYQLETGGHQFRLLVAIDKSQIVSIACFIYNENAIRGYQLAAKKLFDLPVKEVSLFGSCVLGQPSSRERALAAGCDEFDTKPVQFDRLIQKINLALANSVAGR